MLGGAHVVGSTLKLSFEQERLQGVGNLVNQATGCRQLPMKQRDNAVELFHEFLVGEPDKIIEANRMELRVVRYPEVEFGSLRRVLIGVGNIAEGAGFSQLLADSLEVRFANGLSELEAGGGNDFGRCVALGAGHVDGN